MDRQFSKNFIYLTATMPTPKPCTSLNERKVNSVIVTLFYVHLHLYTVANLYQILIFFYFQYVQYWYTNVRYAQV